jgi:hypothetical protein
MSAGTDRNTRGLCIVGMQKREKPKMKTPHQLTKNYQTKPFTQFRKPPLNQAAFFFCNFPDEHTWMKFL